MNMVNKSPVGLIYTYSAFGLIIGSKIELPLIKSSSEMIDVKIDLREVPMEMQNPVFVSPLAMIKPGEAIIQIPDIANYHIRSGHSICVQMLPNSSLDDVIIFLLGSAMASIFHQRGMLPLHASSVYYKNKAILIAGKSGSGKSTLMAELLKRDVTFMSDDITAIHMINGMPMAAPAYPRLKLWENSYALLNMEISKQNQLRKKLNKFYYDIEEQMDQTNKAVSHIFNLTLDKSMEEYSIDKLNNLNAISAISFNTYRYKTLKPNGNLQKHFEICTSLANTARVYQIKRNPFKNTLLELADQIEARVKEQ